MFKKIGLFGVLFCAVAAFSQENYSQWSNYKTLTLNTSASGANVSGNVLNFPLLVRLTSANADVFANSKGRGADIRFAKTNGVHVPYQIDLWDSATQSAAIWVHLDTAYGNNTTQALNMYWGKSGSIDSSNGPAVFNTAAGYLMTSHLSTTTPTDASPDNWVMAQNYTGVTLPESDTAGVIGGAISFMPGGLDTLPSGGVLGQGGNSLDGSYTFTGSSEILDVPDGANYTISGWANAHTGASTAAGMIFCKSGRYYIADTLSGSNYVWELAEYVDGVGKEKVDATLTPGVWHYLVGTRNGSTMTLYVDGVPSTTVATESENWVHVYKSAGIDRDNHADSSQYYVPSAGNGMYFSGAIDEVAFSDSARSANWVNLSYQTQKMASTAVTLGATSVPAGIYGYSSLNSSLSNPLISRVFVSGLGGSFIFHAPAGVTRVRMLVEDMQGRVLADKSYPVDNSSVISWDGRGSDGSRLSSGMYLVQMKVLSGEAAPAVH